MGSRKEYLSLFCRERLGRLAGIILMFFFIGATWYLIWGCTRTGNPFMIIFNILLAAASATAAALLLVALYLPSAANGITSFLLFPKIYLRKAPVSLSPVQGMIAAGDYREAEIRLQDILHRFPDHTAAALMLLEFYADTAGQPLPAAAAAETYLDSKPVRPDPLLHFRLLMRYADLVQGTEKEPELKKRLEFQLKHCRLPRSQTAALQARLNALQTR